MNVKEQYKEMVRSFLLTKLEENPEKKFTKEEVIEFIHSARPACEMLYGAITDEIDQEVVAELLEEHKIQYEQGTAIVNKETRHAPWLNSRFIEFDFWKRYKQYLNRDKQWPPASIRTLEDVSKEILNLCGDPESEAFDIKGLVIGDIQSGKTANYTAICNMAADAGYKVFVILAGMQNNLRSQTQSRLDMEFRGNSNSENLKNGKKGKNIIGVGKYNSSLSMNCLTSREKDFQASMLDTAFELRNTTAPTLFVIKKNAASLRKVNKWLEDNNTYGGGKIHLPLMLIDDEADNASINTNNKDPESDPTVINKEIRRLINLFDQVTYLGVTATPFANIFIDEEDDSDLFPSDFIYALNPPSNYIGAKKIFCDPEYKNRILEVINDEEMERQLPLFHKKTHTMEDLPQDLKNAVYYFLLANVVRDLRGDEKSHRSMLVHISRYVLMHGQIASLLDDFLSDIKSKVLNYGRKDDAEAIPCIQDLQKVWDRYNFENLDGVKDKNLTWKDIRKNYLYESIEKIHIQVVNNSSKGQLDYDLYPDGRRVIAVGGTSLSRGLTLEGLMVSFFYRSTKMYDTLMQMGRWFGYRPGYEDLIKIWMTDDMIGYFEFITQASEELRESIEEMNLQGKSPRDFGLMVRQHPDSALMVTARNKMRNTAERIIPISLSKKVVETPQVSDKLEILESNEREFRNLVNQLSQKGTMVDLNDSRAQNNYLWTDVPSSLPASLIRSFKAHDHWTSWNSEGLASFIDENHEDVSWDVALITPADGEGKALAKPLKYGDSVLEIPHTEYRNARHYGDRNMIQISSRRRIGAAGQMRVGLSNEEVEEIRQKSGKKKGSLSDRDYLTEDRNPIMVLHVINADYGDNEEAEDLPEFLYGISLGFPENQKDNEVASYVINSVKIREYADQESDEDEV